LHIANYYTGSKVYRNLFSALDKSGVLQTVYTAFRGSGRPNDMEFGQPGSKIWYRPILSLYTRIHYTYKSALITKDIRRHVNVGDISLIHAHTWYSDGRSANVLARLYGKPYLVTIRNTDINIFFKYFIHLRKRAKEVLLEAKAIIFISHAYKERLLSHPYFAGCRAELEAKSRVIPNGIEEYWLGNIWSGPRKLNDVPQLLYVGDFRKGKKVMQLIRIVKEMNEKGTACHLHIVGAGGKEHQEVVQAAGKQPELFSYHGKVTEKEALRDLYRGADIFVMASKGETFGLVYVEALSQGLPVVYTRNEGIDGYFPANTGEAVNANDRNEIAAKIKKIIDHYSEYDFTSSEIVKPFSWTEIGKNYQELYQSIVSHK